MSGRATSWRQTLVSGAVDGPTLTAAAAASCIPTPSRITLPNNFFSIGDVMKLTLRGRISCAVTTPGTGRFDVRMGPSGTVVVFDTQAFNLNTAGKTTVPFWLEILLSCRAVGSGTSTNFMGMGTFQSEALVGAPANSAGGNGSLLLPVGAPTVGGGFDNTAANVVDVFWTPSLSTASLTVHQFLVESLT